MVGKLDPRKDEVTRSNPEKVICWEGLSQYPEHINACKNKKKVGHHSTSIKIYTVKYNMVKRIHKSTIIQI